MVQDFSVICSGSDFGPIFNYTQLKGITRLKIRAAVLKESLLLGFYGGGGQKLNNTLD